MDRAGQDIDGTETTAVCKARLGKTFSDVTICVVKLRNFDSSHRCNATRRLRGCIICQRFVAPIIYNKV